MALRDSTFAPFFTRNQMGESAAPYLGKFGKAAQSSIDQFGRDTDKEIAQIGADVIGAQADAREKVNKATINAGERTNKLKSQGNVIKGIGEGLKGVLGLGATLIAASDRRIKNTIEELDNAVSLLKELRPVSFYYNKGYGTDSDRLHYGFIAQEYAEHMPDATYTDDDTGMLCINTMELISILVKANQELEERIARLEVKDKLAGAVR